eukprot:TRINITY_DN6971_c0_g1_i1.p1 TRINITY_DN6971_c0_g1~~TRINITY_DN6971_c0_g1_i1.p1  ORF type:complete len:829 (+),score=115.18 TRINITY_DN6971_c0_g1_i1:408-2894(+)
MMSTKKKSKVNNGTPISGKQKKPKRRTSTEEMDCSLLEDTHSLLALSAATEFQNVSFNGTPVTSPSDASKLSPSEPEPCEFGACDFCRRRHMPCIGRPECANCKKREQKCIFTPKRKPGPPLGYKRPAKEKKMDSSVSPECESVSEEFESDSHIKNRNNDDENMYYSASPQSVSPEPLKQRNTTPFQPPTPPVPKTPFATNPSLPVIPTPQHAQHHRPRVGPFGPQTVLNNSGVLELNISGSVNKLPANLIANIQTYSQLLHTKDGGHDPSSPFTAKPKTPGQSGNVMPNISTQPSPTPASPYLMLFQNSPPPTLNSPLPAGIEISSLADLFSPDTNPSPSPSLHCEEPNNHTTEAHSHPHLHHPHSHPHQHNGYVNTSALQQQVSCSSSLVSYSSSASTISSTTAAIIAHQDLGNVLVPYAEYIAMFRKRHKDDPMGIFNFVEVPSLEYLLPLAATNIEGRVKQMLLFSQLALGALGKKHRNRAIFFGEEAYRLYCEHIKWKQQEEQRNGMSISQEEASRVDEVCCASMILLATFCYAMGQLERAHKLSFLSYQLSIKLLDFAVAVIDAPITPNWVKTVISVFAHSFGNASAFCSANERAANHDKLFNSICLDPAIRLWLLSGSVVDDLIEAVSMKCPEKPPVDPVNFSRMSHRIMEAEELLMVLQNDPAFVHSTELIKLYSGVFSVWKSVVSWLMGYYHSATSQAIAATHSLMSVMHLGDVLFFCVPLSLLFVAKIHQLNQNTTLYNLCMDALKNMEDTLPAIHYVYNDLLTQNTPVDTHPDCWFPMLWKMLSSLPSLRQMGIQIQTPNSLSLLESSYRNSFKSPL